MEFATSKEKTMFYVHALVMIALIFGFGLLPPIDPITPYGMKILGCFLGCFYGWLTGQYIWPTLLAIMAAGYYTSGQPLSFVTAAFGNQTALLCVFAYIFAASIRNSGLIDVISSILLSSKIAAKGPWVLVGLVWFTTAFVTMLLGVMVPPIIMMWALFYGIMEKLNIPKFHPYSVIVLTGTVFFAHTASIILPYSPVLQMIIGMMQTAIPTAEINIIGYTLFWIIMNLLFIVVLIVLFGYILRVKAPFSEIKAEELGIEKQKLTTPQKVVIVYIVLLCLALMLPSMLPAGNALKTFLGGLGALGAFFVVDILMQLTIIGNKSLVDIGREYKVEIPWDVIFLLMGALVLAPVVTNAETGITVAIGNVLTALLGGKSAYVFAVTCVIFGSILTNAINNTACMILMIPLVAPFAVQSGIDYAVICAMYTGVLITAMLLPSGGAGAAVMHGNNEYIKRSDAYKYSAVYVAVFIVLMCIIGVPLANIFI